MGGVASRVKKALFRESPTIGDDLVPSPSESEPAATDAAPAPVQRRIAPLIVHMPEGNAPVQSLPIAPVVQDEDGDEAEEV